MKNTSKLGMIVAFLVIGTWLISITYLMQLDSNFLNPITYIFILIQMHLYTGLFITAHDAMHGTISANRTINNLIGQICTALYAAFPLKKLNEKHQLHHKYVHTENDPDHHAGSFGEWYIKFIREYISWWQILIMAIVFNILKIWISEANLLMFWVLPSLLSTLQLFYFGTWLPHHGEHDNKYQSRSQNKNHFLAFISCYFFGYHYEHHDSPQIPWWQLWKVKENATLKGRL
ncbi:MAG: hypothetical protein JWQ25_1926 [Daejeonella sp.]|nr:hypothetical protein [Daejeonella sp.]